MNPATSLTASAQVFDDIGHAFSADLCRSMARNASIAPALYEHWAREQATRATAKLQQFHNEGPGRETCSARKEA